MTYLHRVIILPAALVDRARDLCAQLAGPPGEGMFPRALSATGTSPATHYCGSGPIEDVFAALLENPAAMFAACEAAGVETTLAECAEILTASDISDESDPFIVLQRLDLRLIEND